MIAIRKSLIDKLVALGYSHNKKAPLEFTRRVHGKEFHVRVFFVNSRLVFNTRDIKNIDFLNVLWSFVYGPVPMNKKVVLIDPSVGVNSENLQLIDSNRQSNNVFSVRRGDSNLCAIVKKGKDYVYLYNNSNEVTRSEDWREVLNTRLKSLNYWNLNYAQLDPTSVFYSVFRDLGIEEGAYKGIIDFVAKRVVPAVSCRVSVAKSSADINNMIIRRLINSQVPLFEAGMKELQNVCT
jgi:hypothetical protein